MTMLPRANVCSLAFRSSGLEESAQEHGMRVQIDIFFTQTKQPPVHPFFTEHRQDTEANPVDIATTIHRLLPRTQNALTLAGGHANSTVFEVLAAATSSRFSRHRRQYMASEAASYLITSNTPFLMIRGRVCIGKRLLSRSY